MNYTKGEWKLSLPKRDTSPYQIATDKMIIADLWAPTPHPDDQPEVFANARLICAAPDLLKNLIELVEQIEKFDDIKDLPITSILIKRSKSIIQKVIT